MKKLVIYYSFEGNTQFIAKSIAEAISADILELKPDVEPSTHGFMKYIWGGKQVYSKVVPNLKEFNPKPEDYDVLFIGTPVWAWTFAPALKAFFKKAELHDKKIALFCCSHGSIGKTLTNMKDELKRNAIVGNLDFIEPKGKEKESIRAVEWAKAIIDKLEDN